jgi:single-strand DNA-binding protein
MLNHTVLIGRIGNELELKTTPSGTEVVSFSLAVQRNYSKDATDWINIVAWKGTATTISRYCKKGDMICVEGSIQTRNYDDKDGKKVYVTEIVAEKIHFVGAKNDSGATTNNAASESPTELPSADDFIPLSADEESELPF